MAYGFSLFRLQLSGLSFVSIGNLVAFVMILRVDPRVGQIKDFGSLQQIVTTESR